MSGYVDGSLVDTIHGVSIRCDACEGSVGFLFDESSSTPVDYVVQTLETHRAMCPSIARLDDTLTDT